MGIPNVCLYILLLNVKYVEESTKLIAAINSFLVILVDRSI